MEDKRLKYSGAIYHQRASWMARWVNVAIVIATYPLEQSNSMVVLLLVAAAVGFNLAAYFTRRERPTAVNALPLVVADNIFVLILLLLTGGLSSPYFLYLLVIPLASAYWFGVVGVTLLMFFDLVAIIIASYWLQPLPALSDLRALVIEVLAVVNVGILAIRLSRAQHLDKTMALTVNARIEAEREQLLALINSMDYAVIATDLHGVIQLYNASALELLNSNLDLKGKTLSEALPLTDIQTKQSVDVLKLAAATSGILRRKDLRYLNGAREYVVLSVTVTPVHPLHGEGQDGYILILRDITKEKSLEDQRDEFISVASHELRTPLAIAEANLSTALLPEFAKIPPPARELVEQAHRNLVFLGDLIRDLTTVSKLQERQLTADLDWLDPAKLLDRLAKDYRAEVDVKGLDFVVSIPSNLPKVFTSESRVQEILQNFITNSIKYTQKGKVELSAEKVPGVNPGVVFSIHDSGIGISTSDQRQLFSKFYRSEDYRTRQTDGTGLGLYIAAKSAELIGAKIWVKSRLNQGSTFYLEVHNSPLPKKS